MYPQQNFIQPPFDTSIKGKMVYDISKLLLDRDGCKTADKQRKDEDLKSVANDMFFFIHKKYFVFQSVYTKKII